MIFTAIIKIFQWFLNLLIIALPNMSSLPASFQNSITWFVNSISNFNNIFDIDLFFWIIGFVITAEIGIFIFNLSVWTYKRIRG